MKKRLVAFMAAGLMAATLFAGCGAEQSKTEAAAPETAASSSKTETATPEAAPASTETKEANASDEGTEADLATATEGFTIGFLDMAIDAPPIVRMRELIRSVVETAGGELICEVSEASAESEINACEKLISAGVSGIIMSPSSDAILPTIISMCDENQVYLTLTFREIKDEEVKAIVEASPYYAGNAYEDEYEAGYNVMSVGFEQRPEIKEVALIALPVGDNTSDARVAGITAACEENGAQVVAEVRNIEQASDAMDAVANFVAAYPDLDCIAVAACLDNASITALPEAIKATGKTADEICIVSSDGGADLTKLFDYGYTISVGGGHLEIDRGSAAAINVNAVTGHKLGNPAHISVPYMYFTTVEDVADYAVYVEGDVPIWTPEEIEEHILIETNPELTPDDVIGFIENYSLDDLIERHADIINK